MRKKKAQAADIQVKDIVIYARYSSDKQTKQSIEGQLRVCRKFAEAHGYNIIDEYKDEAMTGRDDLRPQFQKMIRDSEKRHFQGVLVYTLDRFSRDKYDNANYKQKLLANGVRVLSAQENITDDPSGVLIESLLEGMAQYFSLELSRKVRRGMEINADKSVYNGGTVPLGYRIVNKQYVVDKAGAAIVQEIFERFLAGWTYQEMSNDLNKRGITTARGNAFNKNSFHVILTNKKYIGVYIFDEVERPVRIPPIIDIELFNQVAAKLELNKKAPGRNRAKAEYLLTQKMYCGYCHTMMIGHSSNQVSTKGVIYNYYRCKDSGGNRPCRKKMIGKDFIEDTIIKECKKLLTTENILRIAKEVKKISEKEESFAVIRQLESDLRKKQKEVNNQMASLRVCDDEFTRKSIFADIKQLGKEMETIEKRLSVERAKHVLVSEDQIIDRLTKLADGDIKDITYRRALIRIFVNKIYLYDDKFTITFTTGNEEVTITDVLLDEIERGLSSETLCFLESSVHHEKIPHHSVWDFFIR
ncbi:MAG: recombinase family protein [Lachnospiraceae bacterium]|nr:recombinase family protein [Lachnospiraceae bacterium]